MKMLFNRKLLNYRWLVVGAFALSFGSAIVAKPKQEPIESDEYDLFYDTKSPDFAIRWAFQKICDFVYDPRQTPWPTPTSNGKPATSFDPDDVEPGDIIFVRDAPYYFKHKHKKIKVPYFILTHGEYLDTFKDSYFKYLEDENIIGWFTIHPPKKIHEKVIPLPLGIVQFNDLYDKREEVSKKFRKYRRTKKEKLLYMNFTDWRNPARKAIREYFLTQEYCTHAGQMPFDQYIKQTAEHKFSVCPPGLGPDLYRIYECLLVGTIPIVKRSHMDFMYQGLPILFVDDWQEITQEYLNKKFDEIHSKKYDPKRLFMQFWLNEIQETRTRLFAAYCAEHGI